MGKKKQSRYEKIQQERRMKRVMLSPDVLMSWFAHQAQLGDLRPLYIIRGLPTNALLYNVFNAPEYYGIGFIVGHESFEPIQEGAIIPIFDDIVIMNPPNADDPASDMVVKSLADSEDSHESAKITPRKRG